MKPLSSDDLYTFAEKLGIKHFDVVMHTDLENSKAKDHENLIINLDHGEEGTHWVAFVNNPSLRYCFYFDSYGVVPSEIVRDYSFTTNKALYYSDSMYQHLKSVLCGWYSLFMLYEIDVNNKDPKQIIKLFNESNPQENENRIIRFAKQIN
jgi:hypothetical protein